MARTNKGKAGASAKSRLEHDPRLSAEEAEAFVTALKERGIQNAKIGAFDVDGILRGKYVSLAKLTGALKKGFGFCDVVFGWDVTDTLYDNAKVTGWHTGYPDAPTRIVPESCRELPLEGNNLFFLAEFTGQAEQLCPRG